MPAGTAPNISTWDASPPYRPGPADVNGAALINDPDFPPDDPTTMPSAEFLNTLSKLILAMGATCANAIVSIVGGATPSVAFAVYAPTNAPILSISRPSTGIVRLTWPANSFPPPVAGPVVSLNGPLGTPGMIQADLISNGIEVHTYNSSGVATDLNFTAVYR